jgi:hypothetical protein
VFIKHGRNGTPEHRAWVNMNARCRSKKNRHYGGRGIEVCARWRDSFDAFYEDVGDRPSSKHSLDRIDNNGAYEPGNVRWATKAQQVRNQNRSLRIVYQGREMVLKDAIRLTGVNRETARYRFHKGLPLDEVLKP